MSILPNSRIMKASQLKNYYIDAVVELCHCIYIFEFKLNGAATDALDQIKETGYPQKYRASHKSLRLIGAAFDTKRHTITDWISEDET